MVAVSRDPLLLNSEKSEPVIGAGGKHHWDFWDSDIWKEGDTYVGLMGASITTTRNRCPPREQAREQSGVAKFFEYGYGVWPKFALWTSKDLQTWTPAGRLRIALVDAIAKLRGAHHQVGDTAIPTDRDLMLPAIKGNAIELNVEIDSKESHGCS